MVYIIVLLGALLVFSGGKVLTMYFMSDNALSHIREKYFSILKKHAPDMRDLNLYAAIIAVESGGKPDAVSPAGARGLMQIMPICLKEYQDKSGDRSDVDNLFIPEFNIRVGTWYFRRLIYNYALSEYEALRAYNAGPTGSRNNPALGASYAMRVLAYAHRLNVIS